MKDSDEVAAKEVSNVNASALIVEERLPEASLLVLSNAVALLEESMITAA
jgi:hypothetical protein